MDSQKINADPQPCQKLKTLMNFLKRKLLLPKFFLSFKIDGIILDPDPGLWSNLDPDPGLCRI